METNREIWRSIDGYTNYEVSTHGRVRNATTGRILKPGYQVNGYLYVILCKKGIRRSHRIHRLVANEFIENPLECPAVDHIDGIITNNSVLNLRWSTLSQNQANRKKQSNTTSKYKGVYWSKQSSKWHAHIMLDKKRIHLGFFTDEEEAGRAYDRATIKYSGEFSKTNF